MKIIFETKEKNPKISVTIFPITSLCGGQANIRLLKRLFCAPYWCNMGLGFKISDNQAWSWLICEVFLWRTKIVKKKHIWFWSALENIPQLYWDYILQYTPSRAGPIVENIAQLIEKYCRGKFEYYNFSNWEWEVWQGCPKKWHILMEHSSIS